MTETFESWWERVGCRVVGDPEDYARAAWEYCQRESPPEPACDIPGCPLPAQIGSEHCGPHAFHLAQEENE